MILQFADLLDVLPEKRQTEDGGYSSDEGEDVYNLFNFS